MQVTPKSKSEIESKNESVNAHSTTNVSLASASSCRVTEASVRFVSQKLVVPLILSSGAITQLTEAQARVVVQTDHGEAEGFGSIYLSDLWAWPEPGLSHEQRDKVLRDLCETIARELLQFVSGESAHPLELGLRLHEAVDEQASQATDDYSIPALAQAMCLSPFDAAIHDAAGRAMGVCAMRLYGDGDGDGDGDQIKVTTSADQWFAGGSAIDAVARMLHDAPRERLPAWVVVGKQDDLERDVRPWFDTRGYACFKLKLHGRDVREDVARTEEMVRVAQSWGCRPRVSVDTNEACADADFVLEYLQILQRDHSSAFACLDYLEQPTARDIVVHPYDWRAVSRLKPVLLDEGLTSLDLLPIAAEQGWSGLAIKTCKGHSFALVAAAWAHERGLVISMQDLTNPGISAIHSALFSAYLPTINGVELNSPQFTPAANASYQADWPGLFDVHDGQHVLANVSPIGLGGVGPES